MRVTQVNVFFCEACDKSAATTEETGPYCDPVVTPPPGWNDNHDGFCPDCRASLAKEKAS